MIGKKFSHYEVTHHLGSGGMGDVYQATDLTLGRSVAIKFLPEAFLKDTDRAVRFQREARMLASVNHPNVAILYGSEESDGRSFLVMELVPGETLAERLSQGPLPMAEAYNIALQLAEGLESAHEKGIVHRDLKPANIKVLPNGIVKILDFGLAKVSAQQDPDALTRMTASSPGIILGTPAYMSPEQAKGLEIDPSTDIWAFGCVLYEMLAGRPVFKGKTATEILADILKSEPDWTGLPLDTPEHIRRLLRRCLQKDLRSRFHDIADVRIELEDARTIAALPATPTRSRNAWRERLVWLVALVVIAATAFTLRRATTVTETRVDIATPPEADQSSLAISPDGREIAFTALSTNGPILWLRSLDSKTPRPLPRTEGAVLPFWSPKTHSIGFFAQSKLKRIDLDNGEVRTLADATPTPSGGTWNSDGVIVYSPSLKGELSRIDESGGTVTRLIADGYAPKFLPDGRRFLFRSAAPKIWIGALDSSEPRPLTDGGWAEPISSDRLLLSNGQNLFHQSFDPDRAVMIGQPVLVAEGVSGSADGFSRAVTVSQTRTLAYRASSADGRTRRFAWFDRSGAEISRVGDVGGFSPDMTSDGRLITLSRMTSGSPSIWLLDAARGIMSQFTEQGGSQVSVFSPDDTTVVFASDQAGSVALFKQRVNIKKEEPLLVLPDALVPTDWIPSHLLFRRNSAATGNDIWALPMRGSDAAGEPFPVVVSEHSQRDAQFSPNGKWIAYESDQSGSSEIYVYPFPGPGRERVISKGGGFQARWNPNGKELFYIAPDGQLMSVPTQFGQGDSLEAGTPSALFRTRMGPVFWGVHTQQYVVRDNGQKFLISTIADEALSPINLILNWKPPER